MKLLQTPLVRSASVSTKKPHWVAELWSPEAANVSTEWKKLLPIVIGCKLWGDQWKGKWLLFNKDNMVVVNLWKKGTSAHSDLMSIIRKLFYCSAHNEFTVNVIHIPGIKNLMPDALFRFQFHSLRSVAPEANPHPTRVPQEIWESCLVK